MIRVLTCLGMVSVLLLTSFVTNVYAAAGFPTSDLGVSPSVVGASGEFNEVKITVSGIPGQTGESVTDVDLTPSPCSIQNDITCTGFSDIAIPGIGEGHVLLTLHYHKATATHPPVLQAVALFIIAVGLVFIPSVFTSTGETLFANGTITAPVSVPGIGTGQATIQPL
jgi:hypothetical protein